MEAIQFIGLNELEQTDQDMVNTITTEYYGKIQRALKNITSLVIHIKPHAKEGHRHRYEVHVRAVAPTRIFESKTEDWDLAVSMHKVFKDLESEIGHAFHDN
ncbi:hypothetical protein ACFL3V_02160 [Nanoarchaeota archaeon]